MRHPWVKKRADGREHGFTLVELLIAITIEAIIMGALGMGFVGILKGSKTLNESFGRSGDARIAANYIIADARNSSYPETSTSDTTSCPDPGTPPVSGAQTAVARFNWDSTNSLTGVTTPNIVNYVRVASANALLRRVCKGGSLVSDQVVANNVANAVLTCTPVANCSGTPTGITVTITSTADSNGAVYTYSLSGSFRKLIGAGAPPDTSADLTFLTGFENGVTDPTNKGFFNTVTGAVDVDSSVKRNGAYSLKVNPINDDVAYAQYNFPTSTGASVARIAFRFATLPSADGNILPLQANNGNSGILCWKASSQKLGVHFGTGTVTTAATTMTAGTWYVIDMRVNFSTNPRTMDWRINGVDQTSISSSESVSTGSTIRIGTGNDGATYTANYDDIVVSQTAADYPIGDGKVLGLVPNATGTHNNATNFQNEASSSIGSSPWNKLDEIPADSTADYIKQINSSSSSYVEVGFADTTSGCIDGVGARVSFNSTDSTGNNGQTRIYDGTTVSTVYSGDMSNRGTTIDFAENIVTPTASEWSTSALNGLVARIGYSSDASPTPRWNQVMLEYDAPSSGPGCDVTAPVVSATTAAQSSGGGNVGAIRQGAGYYIYANVTDEGTVASVTTNVSSFDTGVTAAALTTTGGPWTVGGVSYEYRTALLTANTPLGSSSYTYSITSADGTGNSGTDSGNPVTVDKYADVILASAGLLGYWPLDDTSFSVGTDTFIGTAATALTSHTGDLNATWTAVSGNSTTSVLSNQARARRNGSGTGAYYTSASPASANYYVEGDLFVKSILTNDTAGVIGRASTSANTYYAAQYSSTNARWELLKVVSGSSTNLGTSAATLIAGSTYRVKLDMSGTTIRLLVNGTQLVSVTDSAIASTGRAGVRFTGSSSPSDTVGLHLDNWTLVSSPPLASDDKGTNDGTYTSGVMLNTAGALTGNTNTAAQFDGVDDYVSTARQISDDFTIEFWFKSTQGLNTNTQWWGNAGLVDAEVGGSVNDFGVSLRSDGKITAGVGNPDTSIVSSTGGYNDGNWHHVVFRRTKSSGALSLYVDNTSQGSATGNMVSLTAPPNIRFGSIQTGNFFFDGQIDKVAIYNTVMGTGTITDHYQAGTGT